MADYSTLCAVCDTDQVGLSYQCSSCLQTMCRTCFSNHQLRCQETAHTAHHGVTGGEYKWGGRSTRRFADTPHAVKTPPRLTTAGVTNPDDLVTRVNELSAFVDDMVTKYNAVEIKATALQDENRSLRQDLRSAHDNNTKLLLELRELQREQGTLQRDVTNMQREMDDVREKNFVITEDVATLKAEMGKTTKYVAFHARLPVALYPSSTSYVVICSDVLTSVGGGYDAQTGVFTAPVPGTYIFLASAAVNQAGQTFFIDVDGTKIAEPYTNPSYGATTCPVIIKLSVGQKVSMKVFPTVNPHFNGSAQQTFTSFSGLLVHPEL